MRPKRPTSITLNKKKRWADKGQAPAETIVVPHPVLRTTRCSDAHAFREFGFPPVDSSDEAEIMLGCMNEKLIDSLKSKEAAAMRRIMYTNHCMMVVMEHEVLRDLERFEKRAVEKDHDKKKTVAAVQSLLNKTTSTSKKKYGEINQLHKEVDQLRKKLEIAGDEAIEENKMSVEYQSSLHMYGVESLKVAINMTKEWLVDNHLEINSDEFDTYLKKGHATDVAAQKAKVTDHWEVGFQLDGSLDN
ncbi:hypothetical protein Adt_38702 [Abeliophyllum distichum]|uniref:Uncharacterized protein n=1 Tax=Abeliophyllum distichum TaxID=126358 RepID=A0ABD1Q344_9LAMI